MSEMKRQATDQITHNMATSTPRHFLAVTPHVLHILPTVDLNSYKTSVLARSAVLSKLFTLYFPSRYVGTPETTY